MFPCSACGSGYWWILPILMMVVCLFMMRGHFGSMMSRSGSPGAGSHGGGSSDAALDVLNKRYAQGEISEEEYEKKRSTITGHDRP